MTFNATYLFPHIFGGRSEKRSWLGKVKINVASNFTVFACLMTSFDTSERILQLICTCKLNSSQRLAQVEVTAMAASLFSVGKQRRCENFREDAYVNGTDGELHSTVGGRGLFFARASLGTSLVSQHGCSSHSALSHVVFYSASCFHTSEEALIQRTSLQNFFFGKLGQSPSARSIDDEAGRIHQLAADCLIKQKK